jgi:hypothetical protein
VLGDAGLRARQQAALAERRDAWSPGAVADRIVEIALGRPARSDGLTTAAVR